MKNAKDKKRSNRRKLALSIAALDLILGLMWFGTLITNHGIRVRMVTLLRSDGWSVKDLDTVILQLVQLITCGCKIVMGVYLLRAISQESYTKCYRWIKSSFILLVPILVIYIHNMIFREPCIYDTILDLLLVLGQSTTTLAVMEYSRKLIRTRGDSCFTGPIPSISVVIDEKCKLPKMHLIQ